MLYQSIVRGAAGVATWDEIGFRERVMSAARERGMETFSEVARRAHLDPKYFRDDRPHLPDGRNIRHVLQIAEALEVDPVWLIGLESGGAPLGKESDALEKVAFVSSLAAHLYVAMAQRRPPVQVDMAKLVRMLVEIIDYANGTQNGGPET
jgi:hypothetical protein